MIADIKRRLCDVSALHAVSTFILERSDCYWGPKLGYEPSRSLALSECSLMIDEVLKLPNDQWPKDAIFPGRIDQALSSEGIV